MPMDGPSDKGGMAGYSARVAKKNKPNSKKKIAARQEARKAFVASKPGVGKKKARMQFYVQTRIAEAGKSGKKLDRKALRQKFLSGDVRKGFGAPKKKTGTKARLAYADELERINRNRGGGTTTQKPRTGRVLKPTDQTQFRRRPGY